MTSVQANGQQKAKNQATFKTDALLLSVAKAANVLLKTEDFEEGINRALAVIGEGIDADQVVTARTVDNVENPSLATWQILYVWTSPSAPAELKAATAGPKAESYHGTYEGREKYVLTLRRGEIMSDAVKNMPDNLRSILERAKVKNTYFIPISVGGAFWGCVGIHDCRCEQSRSAAELSVLETAAACIGSAIERDLNQKEKDAIAQARAAELETYNQRLEARDSLLHCVNLAAQHLVAVEEVYEALPGVLEILGQGTRQCRSYILKNTWNEAIQEKEFELMLEWNAPGIPAKQATGGQFPVPISRFPERLTAPLRAGEATQFLARELDGISAEDRMAGQARSLMGVPIIIRGEWWGLLGLDDCIYERLWSDAEITVLKTAATAIGNAIERSQAREARIAAEKAVLAEQEKAAREHLTELSKMNEAVSQTLTALAADPETDGFLGLLLQELYKQTGACKTHLHLYDAATNTLHQHCTVQDGVLYIGTAPRDPQLFSGPIPADLTGGWQTILDSPMPLALSDWSAKLDSGCAPEADDEADDEDDFWWPGVMPWNVREGHREVVCSRMKVGDIPIGFIGFCFRDRMNLSPVQLEFIQALTNQATLSVYLTRLADQTQSAALIEERNRLAREIHDTLAQAFTGISLQLEAARGRLCNPEPKLDAAEASLLRARDLARKGLSEARRSVRALRSEALETDTLTGALRKMLSQTARDTNLATQFRLEGEPIPISDSVQLNLLRIAQEATTNVLRHAQATKLEITLSFIPGQISREISGEILGETPAASQENYSGLGDRPQQVQLLITDNGSGFDLTTLTDSSGFGIVGIRERTARLYGEIDLQSTVGSGTKLMVTVPLR